MLDETEVSQALAVLLVGVATPVEEEPLPLEEPHCSVPEFAEAPAAVGGPHPAALEASEEGQEGVAEEPVVPPVLMAEVDEDLHPSSDRAPVLPDQALEPVDMGAVPVEGGTADDPLPTVEDAESHIEDWDALRVLGHMAPAS